MRRRWWLLGLGAIVGLLGCQPQATTTTDGGTDQPAASSRALPDAAAPLRFWHTQTQENATALEEIVKEFNATHPDGPPIEATYIGAYPELYNKIVTSAAETKRWVLPDLAVAYESMIADYMQANIVLPLDDLVADPKIGLTQDDLADIHQPYLETNRFQQFGGKLLSFPFTKSNLMLYYNQTMLDEVKLGVPKTWDELLAACKAIKAKRGILPFACSVDASTLDGMVLSMGGKLLGADGTAQFDQPPAVAALTVLQDLFTPGDELAYQVLGKGDQNNDFANEKCAFFFRSSTARPYIQELVGKQFKWSMAGLPTAPGIDPLTVMFGANICVFRTTPERERQAWQFIKYFTSTKVTAHWAMVTGYLPVRRSAAETDEMKQFFAAEPQNKIPYSLLDVAVSEPNVAGWQAARDCLENAETAVVTQLKTAAEVAPELDLCVDQSLADAKQQ